MVLDNGFTLLYHPGKANVVADDLSRKSSGTLTAMWLTKWLLIEQLCDLDMNLQLRNRRKILVASFHVWPQLI